MNLERDSMPARAGARVSPVGEFGNVDRQYRSQWLKDQVLSHADRQFHQVRFDVEPQGHQ